MNFDSDKELQKLLEIACSVVVEDTNLFSAVLSARRRAKRCQRPKIKAKQGRLIYARPTYACSTWLNNVTKRRLQSRRASAEQGFSVPFTMFEATVSEAGEGITDGGKRVGDVTTDWKATKIEVFWKCKIQILPGVNPNTPGSKFADIEK